MAAVPPGGAGRTPLRAGVRRAGELTRQAKARGGGQMPPLPPLPAGVARTAGAANTPLEARSGATVEGASPRSPALPTGVVDVGAEGFTTLAERDAAVTDATERAPVAVRTGGDEGAAGVGHGEDTVEAAGVGGAEAFGPERSFGQELAGVVRGMLGGNTKFNATADIIIKDVEMFDRTGEETTGLASEVKDLIQGQSAVRGALSELAGEMANMDIDAAIDGIEGLSDADKAERKDNLRNHLDVVGRVISGDVKTHAGGVAGFKAVLNVTMDILNQAMGGVNLPEGSKIPDILGNIKDTVAGTADLMEQFDRRELAGDKEGAILAADLDKAKASKAKFAKLKGIFGKLSMPTWALALTALVVGVALLFTPFGLAAEALLVVAFALWVVGGAVSVTETCADLQIGHADNLINYNEEIMPHLNDVLEGLTDDMLGSHTSMRAFLGGLDEFDEQNREAQIEEAQPEIDLQNDERLREEEQRAPIAPETGPSSREKLNRMLGRVEQVADDFAGIRAHLAND